MQKVYIMYMYVNKRAELIQRGIALEKCMYICMYVCVLILLLLIIIIMSAFQL